MSKAREAKAAKIRQLMETEGDAVNTSTSGFNEGRYQAVQTLDDYEGLKAEARAIKEDAIERLPDLLDQLRETIEENGGTMYIADDAADANRYIREVCEDKDAERVVKSKSMTSEEIEVNDELEAADVDVVETDLGEWVLQVADEAPSHIVAPAIHKSREAIADLFNETFEPDEPLQTAEELTMFARQQLGELIEGADVGMTGANFITADTGTMALVTSEGNARKTAVVPDTHVAVAGVEKVVPAVEDLQPFIELIGKSGTGQNITSYISLLTPPVESPTVDFDDPDTPITENETDRDFHLVLIDNGRLDMRDDEQLRETLYCIRCSACSNVCANFQHVGGHAFGGETYSGGIGTGWEAGVEGLDSAAEFNDLCTGCSRCTTACPVNIDIPWINTVVRDRVNRGEVSEVDWLVDGLTPDEEPGGVSLQKRFFGNFETAAKVGSTFAPVSNWVTQTSVSRNLMERFLGIDARRELPSFQRETLKDWFDARDSHVQNPTRTAVLYPDVYTNHVQVERGKAAVRTLEALGVDVVVPDVRSSGRAPLSQGMIATAEDHAHDVYAGLAEYIDEGRDIVVIEPSDLAMFDNEYEKFLSEKSFQRLSDSSFEVMEYVFGLLENGAPTDALESTDSEEVAYHSHCQQRTLGLEGYTEAVLADLGYDVATSDVECCGMAGSFGYKSEYYELSMDVGSELQGQFQTDETRNRTVVASGTSCLEQLDSLLRRPSRHPVELIAPRR
ncbi:MULTISPECIES: LUD domain-containing protein [Haloferax]|uniref:(4Fe-4S)-binding protein n=2 Tax=Haloferax TaxID=2251 RepID=A0A6G1Z3J2_9EURY|nr:MULTISPECIES: LUD domain-containing protein [Haloferax]KAB1188292.1 (4Fe-4S)-binding protein [Haloferax sp. CBA1149]MRW80981.1 (4Fe-4S)-binding protein [Haloferax marinisediminis]